MRNHNYDTDTQYQYSTSMYNICEYLPLYTYQRIKLQSFFILIILYPYLMVLLHVTIHAGTYDGTIHTCLPSSCNIFDLDETFVNIIHAIQFI